MTDIINKIKIKKPDGSFTDYIPIGAEAQNILTSDGDSVQLKLGKKPYYYNSIADMKADTKLKVGDMVITLGYYEVNDGGNGEYRIVSGDYMDDGGSYHRLNNNLYAELIIKESINLKQFGAIANGVTNNDTYIQKLLSYFRDNENTKTRTIVIPKGEFVFQKQMLIDFSYLTIKGEQGNLLKYVGMGDTGRCFYLHGVDADNYVHDIIIDGVNLDGTGQIFKGGESLDTPALTHPKPAAAGLKCVRALFAADIEVKNCHFHDFYGEGIDFKYTTNVEIKNNYITDCGGGNIVWGGATGYDSYGDGIVIFMSYDTRILDNSVINTRTYKVHYTNPLNSDCYGQPCGRSGLEYEYAINADSSASNRLDPKHNAPRYQLLIHSTTGSQTPGNGLIMENNYVYGYTKGIHLEANVRCIITNNAVVHNHIGLMNTTGGQTVIAHNYFNNDGLGRAPQSGYHLDSGGIALSPYASTKDIVVENNILVMNNGLRALTIGQNECTIIGNKFYLHDAFGIYDIKGSLHGIVISNNIFEQWIEESNVDHMIYLYNDKDCILDNNQFISRSKTNRVSCEGANYTRVKNNVFTNTVLDFNGARLWNSIVEGNTFKGYTDDLDEHFTWIMFTYQVDGPFIVSNNYFDISNLNDNIGILKNTGRLWNTTFYKNTIYVKADRDDTACCTTVNMKNLNISYNEVKNNNENFALFNFSWNQSGWFVCENNELDNPRGWIYKGGAMKAKIKNNVGRVPGNYNQDNLTKTWYSKGEILWLPQLTTTTVDGIRKTLLGKVALSEGYYNTNTWVTNHAYSKGNLIVASNNNVYRCEVAGTSSVEPIGTSDGVETGADEITWRYMGPVVTFRNIYTEDTE